MIKIVNLSEIVYIYDVNRGGYTHKFESTEDVLKFLAANRQTNWYNTLYTNPYLDNINMGNDKEIRYERVRTYDAKKDEYVYQNEPYLIDKPYIFIDGYNRIIDVRIYSKIIEMYANNGFTDYRNSWAKRKKRKIVYSEFRREPVQYTGKRSNSRYYRMIRTFNECRQNSAVEIQDYVRVARKPKSLPDNRNDDFVRSRCKSKSWKDCTKKRKQWM